LITASIFDTKEALYQAVLRQMGIVIQQNTSTPTALMVPGGNTPRPLFEALAEAPIAPTPQFYLGYTDERHVPDTDPQNNYRLTVDMIRALELSPFHVLRVQTHLSLEEAAARYHMRWQDFFDQGGEIPLGLLGLGDDGHTCSLFTREQVEACDGVTFAAPVQREPGPNRITVTPALLARIKHIIFFVTGQAKAAIVDAILNNPESVTAGMAVAQAARVSLWYAPQD
jgi:6-phosphogluconolactonase